MKQQRWTAEQVGSQEGRLAVVTGANSGIGYEAAEVLAGRGAHVVLACRDVDRGEEAARRICTAHPSARVETLRLDLSDLVSVRRFAQLFSSRFERLDLLINNAGVMIPPQTQTADGFELQLGVNHLGHFALTGLLLEHLLATEGSRVVSVASMAHRWGRIDFDDLQWEHRRYDKWQAYGQSKLANLLFAYELQRRLAAAGKGTLSTAAHPGWTLSDLQRHSGPIRVLSNLFAMKAAQGALPTLRAATDPEAQGGEYFGPGGFKEMSGYPVRVQSTEASHDRDVAARLWSVSEDLTGVRYETL